MPSTSARNEYSMAIIVNNFQPLENYFGIAKVKILPLYGLHLPSLPYRSNRKLKIPLCQTCANLETQGSCCCSRAERALSGTWATPELAVTIWDGYVVLKIYEVYHWRTVTTYDLASGEGGLFANYVNLFLKLKQEASGFPENCLMDPIVRAQYMSDYA